MSPPRGSATPRRRAYTLDSRLIRACVLAAIGLTLLVPVFGALNNSYVQNVRPPPWMPTPPTPPDITPPSDFKPPPDMTPPTNFHGKIPPNMCPPPVAKVLVDNQTRTFSQSDAAQGFAAAWPFNAPNGTIAVVVNVSWSNWQAGVIAANLDGPKGYKGWENHTDSQSGGLIFDTGPQNTEYDYDTYTDTGQTAKVGPYTLHVSADRPYQGSVTVRAGVILACGGLGS